MSYEYWLGCAVSLFAAAVACRIAGRPGLVVVGLLAEAFAWACMCVAIMDATLFPDLWFPEQMVLCITGGVMWMILNRYRWRWRWPWRRSDA